MEPAFDSSPIRSLADFREHVLATGFRGDMFAYRTWPRLVARGRVYWDILALQFGAPLTLAALLASIPLARRRPRLAGMLLGIWAIHSLVAISYRAPQTVEYLLPAYVALAALLGFGLAALCDLLQQKGSSAAAVSLLLILAGANGLRNGPSLRVLHRDSSTRQSSEALLNAAPEGTLILANWHQATPLWYLQLVEGMRPDVTVRYVYPEGTTPNETVWLRRIDEAIAQQPVIVTNRFHGYTYRAYQWEPVSGGWRVRAEPIIVPPDDMTPSPAVFAGAIELLGYRLARKDLAPGETVTVWVYWRPTDALSSNVSSFCQLVGPQGAIAQGDIAHRSSDYAPGGVRVDAYDLALLPQTQAGDYALLTGFYTSDASGWQRLRTGESADHQELTQVRVTPGRHPATTLHPTSRPLANGLELRGYDVDCSLGGQTRLYLHWRRRPQMAVWGPWRATEAQPLSIQAWRDEELLAQTTLPALLGDQTATTVLDLGPTEDVTIRLSRGDGSPCPELGPWNRQTLRGIRLTLPTSGATFVPLGGEMVFVGLEEWPDSLTGGDSVTLVPRFLAARPLTHDYSISLGLHSDDATWEVKSDGTPALGAIPTLKWLSGWQVRDPRTIEAPLTVSGEQAGLTLEVYDAFSLRPLQILDERRVQQGQGVALELGTVSIR